MKISNYPEVEALNEDDLLVISRPGEGTKSVSIAALAQLLAAGVGNAVANNLNVTEEGYILDARQGKVLGDRDTYSTEERVVGTWIGKPLYRRIVSGTVTTGNVTVLATGFPDYTHIKRIYGVRRHGSTTGFMNATTSDGRTTQVYYQNGNIYGQNSLGYTVDFDAMIEYTKPTD